MPRQRIIKPEFWVSSQIVSLPALTRLCFIGLWNFADDGGVLPADSRQVKLQVFPGDEDIKATDVAAMIAQLQEAGLLSAFSAEGRDYWYITGWHRHQRIDRPTYRHPQPSTTRSSAKNEPPTPSKDPAPQEQAEPKQETNTTPEYQAIKEEVVANVERYQNIAQNNGWKKEYGMVRDKVVEFDAHYSGEKSNPAERAAYKRDPVAFFRMKFPAWIKKGADFRARDIRGKPQGKNKAKAPPPNAYEPPPINRNRESQHISQLCQ